MSSSDTRNDLEGETPSRTNPNEASRHPQVTFDSAIDGRQSRWDRPPKSRSSHSRDSISRVRSSSRSVSGIPTGFRTLSFHVTNSHERRQSGSKEGPEPASAHFPHVNFHLLSVQDVCQLLTVSPAKGLNRDDALARLQSTGKNILPQLRQHYWKKLLSYVFGGFCSVLWVAVIVFFLCWKPLGKPPQAYYLGLAILILIVILLQVCFSAFQDWSTKKTMQSILDLLPSEALVLRDGDLLKIPASDIVCGDVVSLNMGNKVPADLRLINTSGDVRFDRSVLTGESDEVEGSIDSTDPNFLESRNIALMGTMVTNGSAQGVVVLTGARTAMGTVAKATMGVKEPPTLIQREIARFVKIIIALTICLTAVIFFTWLGWLHYDHSKFMNVVAMLSDVTGCLVAFIPEGIPVAVALTFLVVAVRMKTANVLPKGLSTVETLGCVNVICSDKTGTLTENKMSVTSVGFVDRLLTAEEASTALSGSGATKALEELYRASLLCNNGTFNPLDMHLPAMQRQVEGNATDAALLRFMEAARSGQGLRQSQQRAYQIPFNSKNKWMLTLHTIMGDEKEPYLVTIKGAPDVLFPHCSSFWSYRTGTVDPLDDTARASIHAIQEQLSRNAERVVLLCQRYYRPVAAPGTNEFGDEITAHCLHDLTIIGVLGILDPPRKDAAATVAACRRAGIRFFMVTGDFGLTAAAIARRVGIFSGEREPDTYETIVKRTRRDVDQAGSSSNKSLLLEGPRLAELTADDWDIVCRYEEIVFGRTTPHQKLLIVTELKKRGQVVAATGDGVNDAPALRAANVGIAIASGSDVALEAADLVLLSHFDSIVDGIRLGRLVFQNLQKVITYLLPAGSWSEIWPVLLNVFFGVPLPLSSFLMIIICVFTDLFCSLSLILEKEEFDLLDIPPRHAKKDHLINLKIYIQSYLFIGIMETLCAHSMFFYYMYKYAGIPVHALFFAFQKYSSGFYGYTAHELSHFNTVGQSVYFVTLVILQWGNILSVRNKRLSILQADPIRKKRRNPWLLASVALSLAIAVFVTEEPGIQHIFVTASVPIEFWLLPLPLALGVLVIDEVRKLVVRMWPKGPVAKIAW